MASASEQQALQEIESRRLAGAPFDEAELRERIRALGSISLRNAHRHDALREVYDALSIAPFRLMPFPDGSFIDAATHRVRIQAVLVDEAVEGQVAAEIVRDFHLDHRVVVHELLRVQDPYRGTGLSHLLLNQAFSFYRTLGLDQVMVHAALEAGRWHWARMGFVPATPKEQDLIDAWSLLCLHALGRPLLAPGGPVSQLALLGYGPASETSSFQDLHNAVTATLPGLRGDPAVGPLMAALETEFDYRVQLETNGKRNWLDEDRFRDIADAQKVAFDGQLPLGKTIMLAGPDWYGTFDLHDPVAQQVFQAEYLRKMASSP